MISLSSHRIFHRSKSAVPPYIVYTKLMMFYIRFYYRVPVPDLGAGMQHKRKKAHTTPHITYHTKQHTADYHNAHVKYHRDIQSAAEIQRASQAHTTGLLPNFGRASSIFQPRNWAVVCSVLLVWTRWEIRPCSEGAPEIRYDTCDWKMRVGSECECDCDERESVGLAMQLALCANN